MKSFWKKKFKRKKPRISKDIVFINQATGYLTIDIVNSFTMQFDRVALITGSVRIQDVELNRKVEVSKIIRYDRGNNFKKVISWMIGTFQTYLLLRTKYRKFEVFYYTIPPTAYLLAPLFQAPFSILIYDLYPDALQVIGFSENNFIYKWWSRRNLRIFSKAKKVITISDNLRSKVIKYAPDADVEVIPNWSAFSGKQPISKEQNEIVKREGLGNKFIVQYSGNIGVTHNVETIVELAVDLKDEADIEFLIIGRGERQNVIKELIESKNLSNCKLLPFRRDEELYESLCVADLAVVTLDDKVPDISVPSKVYNILTAGVPVMAIAAHDSSIATLVHDHKVGKTFAKEDIDLMKDYILELKNDFDLRSYLASNALAASQQYTNRNAVKVLECCAI
ncbi:glycosyltransferase family 4 protein [Saccharicrinis sp. GN24d3]|uniref:glycosyltransferase family 4 protein n=1 Tax=Saccharicrinis sp. GN24d3 TaxID=3458416 RepID=UPI0040369C58